MKRTFALILAFALTLSMLTACGSHENTQSGEQENIQSGEQYINTYITSDPSTLDCARFLGLIDRVILHSITESGGHPRQRTNVPGMVNCSLIWKTTITNISIGRIWNKGAG